MLMNDAVIADWVSLPSPPPLQGSRFTKQNFTPVARRQSTLHEIRNELPTHPSITSSSIVEAQSWVVDNNGNVILIAQVSTANPYNPILNPHCPLSEIRH